MHINRSTLFLGFTSLLSLSTLVITKPAVANQIDFSSWFTTGDVLITSPGTVSLSNASSIFADDFPAPVRAFNFSGNDTTATEAFGGSLETDLSLLPGSQG